MKSVVYVFRFILLSVLLINLLSACKSDAKVLPLVQETAHARFYSPNDDAAHTVAILAEAFEANYDRLTALFQYEAQDKAIIHVYTDRDAYQKMIGRDTEGTYDARDRIIKVYTPADLSNETTRRNFNEQIVHEFVHLIIQQISPNVGKVKWLDEGTAYYASGQLEKEMLEKPVYYDIPTFEEFADPDYFNKARGAAYFYSGLIVKYIADHYGVETLNAIILQPEQKHVEKILNTSLEQFFAEWRNAMLNS